MNDGEISKGTAPGTVGTTNTSPEMTSTISEQGHCSNSTAPGTVDTTVTVPEVKITIH